APNYKILLGHRKAEIKPVTEEGGVATFEVTVVGAEGAVVIYSWSLQKVDEGDQKGAWMTTSVSPPVGMGNEI
ncbi:MAG: hypothetical protein KTR19_12850, partial [Hyphomicrobiales bacterium]|nr:hypothetical protein [Hyphomicrobiales bacterium]